jgi:hypothetical protein
VAEVVTVSSHPRDVVQIVHVVSGQEVNVDGMRFQLLKIPKPSA